MKIETQEQLQALFERTNFFDEHGGPEPIVWDYVKHDTYPDDDGKERPCVHVGEAACLGNSTIQCANNCERSGEDHFFIGELARLFAAGKLVVK